MFKGGKMSDDTGLVIGVGIILFLLFYNPASSEVLWANDCSSVEGFTISRYVYTIATFEPFSETYGVPPYCIRAYCGNQGDYVIGETPITPQITADPSTGEYSFVMGARIKIKSVANAPSWNMHGGLFVTLNDVNGNVIGGFRAGKVWNYDQYKIWSLPSQTYTPALVADIIENQWVDVEVFVNPHGSKLLINGKLVVQDTTSHINAPPVTMKVGVDGFSTLYFTEALVDQLYVKKATSWYWGLNIE
jgi:hypothetical protein